MSFEQQSKGIDQNEALARVSAMMHQELQRGAVDEERGKFESIIRMLKDGSLTPGQALAMAEAIVAGRQDYH